MFIRKLGFAFTENYLVAAESATQVNFLYLDNPAFRNDVDSFKKEFERPDRNLNLYQQMIDLKAGKIIIQKCEVSLYCVNASGSNQVIQLTPDCTELTQVMGSLLKQH